MVELSCVQYLRICSESLVSLELSRCFSLRTARVSAARLGGLFRSRTGGTTGEISIEHAPLLSKVSFCEAYCTSLVNRKFKQFERVLSQLRTLKLTMSFPSITTALPKKLDGLISLKNLELKSKVWDCDHPLSLYKGPAFLAQVRIAFVQIRG